MHTCLEEEEKHKKEEKAGKEEEDKYESETQYFPFARKCPPSGSWSANMTDTLTAFDPPFPLIHLLASGEKRGGRREEEGGMRGVLSSCRFVTVRAGYLKYSEICNGFLNFLL